MSTVDDTPIANEVDAVATTPIAKNRPELTEPDGSKRRYLVFAIVITAVVMSGLDSSIVATALPTLRNSLHARLAWAAWTITAYQFGQTLALPISGRISDQFGRRRVFLTCLVIFTVSSAGCAISSNIYELVAFRAIQAMGGGGFFPSAIGIITDHFGKDRDRAVGMVSSTGPIGTLLGPVVGGVIIAWWSWRGAFLINVPIGIAVFVLTLRFIPRSKIIDSPKPDFVGVALMAATILPGMYGITTIGSSSHPFESPIFIVAEVVAIIFGWMFIHHAKTAAAPIIPWRLLAQGAYGKLNLISYLNGGVTIGAALLLPLYGEERYHFKSIEAGSALSARSLGALIVAGTVAFLIRRIGYRRPLILGTVITAASIAMLSIAPHGLSPYAWIAIGALGFGIGLGMTVPCMNNAMLHKTINEAGSISGLRQMTLQVGAITAISIMTSIAARSSNQGLALGHSFFVFSIIIIVLILPLVLTVTDHRGRW